MKNKLLLLFVFALTAVLNAQITWEPLFPTEKDSVVVYFNAAEGNQALKGYTGDVYAHTGVITNLSTSPSNWKAVKTNWGVNTPETKLTRIGTDRYKFVIRPSIRTFYTGLASNEIIKQVAFVFRSAVSPYREGKTAAGADIFMDVYQAGLNLTILSPSQRPLFVNANETVPVKAVASGASKLSLYLDGKLLSETTADTIAYNIIAEGSGKKYVRLVAASSSGATKSDSFYYMVNPSLNVSELPAGVKDGINYNGNSVTLCLYAPDKKFVYLIGDFNNWETDKSYYMNITPDGKRFWFTINGLTPKTEYGFQYFVDGQIRIPDPYTDKILDPWNDSYIPSTVYPNLKKYPSGKTDNIVSVFQPGEDSYQWKTNGYQRPDKSNLVIYELHVRDFVSTHSYKTLADTLGYLKRLGINAIELMPVNEFEGNESWGYNPMMYFAPDKYYGTKNDLKAFIDAAHSKGMAVIIDLVLNHAFGLNPMVRLYWDAQNNRPAANSPWFNVTSPNPVYYWGSDFNHEAKVTQDFVDRVNSYWMTEYKVDGFRFDFTKGFTNTPGDGWARDVKRIAILKRMYDKIVSVDSTAYVILEHLTDNTEEKELADYGMLLWGNMNDVFDEVAMGYTASSNFANASYKARGWSKPNLVAYMESHDEERLMYKNYTWGNISGSYSTRDTATALNRIKLSAAFLLTLPGPKMFWQFGELGYDYSIEYNGRVGNKPIRWDYYKQQKRLNLYKTFQEIIRLKTTYKVFRTADYSLTSAGAIKKLQLNDDSMKVFIIGNCEVISLSSQAGFQSTGMWYDYFSGDSLDVTNTQMYLNLAPGEFHIYTSVKLPAPEKGIVTGVERTDDGNTVIEKFALEQNYPNPFNPSTRISFSLPEGSAVTLRIYDILGREVRTLVNSELDRGSYSISWNGDDNFGNGVSSGIYFYRLDSKAFTSTKKMMLVR
ncbi:MAG: alpha-amylase family glycosyl hydrolase [Bacteroidota bacterium]